MGVALVFHFHSRLAALIRVCMQFTDYLEIFFFVSGRLWYLRYVQQSPVFEGNEKGGKMVRLLQKSVFQNQNLLQFGVKV